MSETKNEAGRGDALTPQRAIALIHELSGVSISRQSLFRWMIQGRLPSTRVGSRLYTNEAAIRAMLAADVARKPASSVKNEGPALAARARIEAALATGGSRRGVRRGGCR
jgi:hypothetical protein